MDFRSSILNTTLGDLVRSNEQARNLILQAMQIAPSQLDEMLLKAQGNEMMNMTISELFQNGLFQKAQNINLLQNSDQQNSVIALKNMTSSGGLAQTPLDIFKSSEANVPERKTSFFKKIKNLFN